MFNFMGLGDMSPATNVSENVLKDVAKKVAKTRRIVDEERKGGDSSFGLVKKEVNDENVEENFAFKIQDSITKALLQEPENFVNFW